MSNKKYLVGDKIGPHKCLFLEEVSAKRRSGKFLCGQCNKNYFISRVDAVVSGSTWRCTDC